jgi:tRNA pseudouridine55 synthase
LKKWCHSSRKLARVQSLRTEPVAIVPRAYSPYNGLLIVDKPGVPSAYLPTSHDIVASVRKWSGQRRIGHTGTLDPMASGVLVLCLGKATRLVEYYQGHDKQYLADIVLGSATDTYDAMGVVTDTAPIPDLGMSELEPVLDHFRGEIVQTPPAYSAIKSHGEALHRKARRGEAVTAPSRHVNISRLDLLEIKPGGILRVRVVCSAGAYIRSLANDLGIALGTCAHLAGLRREAAGSFTLDDAHPLEVIEISAQNDTFEELLLPMGTGLELPVVQVDTEAMSKLGYGQHISLQRSDTLDSTYGCEEGDDALAQALAPDGTLAGIIRCIGVADTIGHETLWRATKWLYAS